MEESVYNIIQEKRESKNKCMDNASILWIKFITKATFGSILRSSKAGKHL